MIANICSVTVFNARTDKATRRKVFIPSAIKDVSYVEAKGTEVTNNGVWSSDVQYKLRIPLISEVQDNRVYLTGSNYTKLEDDEVVKHWTINRNDLVIKGDYTGEKKFLFEDELTAYAKEQGLDLIHVTEYADNTFGGSLYTKHWRIGGK